jgi:hypothetical protein
MRERALRTALLAGVVAATLAPGPAAGLPPAERAAVFKAAGFKQQGDAWRRCEEETPMASSIPGSIELVDLNADGAPEAVVTESSLFCYGATEGLVVVLTKSADGGWRKILDSPGTHLVRDTKHGGWRDIEVGGPGLQAQPVYHWSGTAYVKSK